MSDQETEPTAQETEPTAQESQKPLADCYLCDDKFAPELLATCHCGLWLCPKCNKAHDCDVYQAMNDPSSPIQFSSSNNTTLSEATATNITSYKPKADDFGCWLTLREAEKEVGVAIQTLRKWYRSGDIHTRETNTVYGQGSAKLVNLGEIKERAEKFARFRGDSFTQSLAKLDARLTALEWEVKKLKQQLP